MKACIVTNPKPSIWDVESQIRLLRTLTADQVRTVSLLSIVTRLIHTPESAGCYVFESCPPHREFACHTGL